jgi:putative oxidoreductase
MPARRRVGLAVFNQKEDVALLVGRLFVASMFLPSGIDKLMNFSKFTASLASKGFPYAKAWAVLTVAAEVLGSIGLIIGAYAQWTAAALIVLTCVTTWATHKWAIFDLAVRQPQNAQFFRNVAVIAGLLFYFVSGPGGYSWRRGAAG